MAKYGTFTYGTGVLYGTSGEVTPPEPDLYPEIVVYRERSNIAVRSR